MAGPPGLGDYPAAGRFDSGTEAEMGGCVASAVPTAPDLKCFYLRGLQTSCRCIGGLFFFFLLKTRFIVLRFFPLLSKVGKNLHDY